MRLYHGTAERHMHKILKQGIKPRGRGRSNWKHSVESNAKCVYLTSAYPLHFAYASVDTNDENDRLAVIEVDTSKLYVMDMLPDEDFLEQATRKIAGPNMAPIDKDMAYRTRWYRRQAHDFQHYWLKSVKYLGTCCHSGVVPVRALTRVAYIERKTYGKLVAHGCDPIIHTSNFMFCAAKYRNYVAYLFNDPLEQDPLEFPGQNKLPYPGRDGVEVVEL